MKSLRLAQSGEEVARLSHVALLAVQLGDQRFLPREVNFALHDMPFGYG
ncbi:hypothetical protein [Bradyrhizobium sp. BR2003]|nr:hypothetical protein [Bradyrhizobium sp. BR2003]